jgi:hypothetical protein
MKPSRSMSMRAALSAARDIAMFASANIDPRPLPGESRGDCAFGSWTSIFMTPSSPIQSAHGSRLVKASYPCPDAQRGPPFAVTARARASMDTWWPVMGMFASSGLHERTAAARTLEKAGLTTSFADGKKEIWNSP